jgi:FixJ family two-component response regulator
MQDCVASPPNVFVVDDDEQFLESLIALLRALEFHVRGFNSPSSFLNFYRADMPGCLVLDIHMPRQTGLQLYDQLIRENKRLPVIFIAAHADVSTAVAAMKRGAIEFLEKPLDRDTLLKQVRNALDIDAESRRENARYAAICNRLEQLNERERETLTLIQNGESNKAMATTLFLTERAVEMRRSTIMRKLQVSSVAELLELVTTYRILTEQRCSMNEARFKL